MHARRVSRLVAANPHLFQRRRLRLRDQLRTLELVNNVRLKDLLVTLALLDVFRYFLGPGVGAGELVQFLGKIVEKRDLEHPSLNLTHTRHGRDSWRILRV